jgi:hypothetical protein
MVTYQCVRCAHPLDAVPLLDGGAVQCATCGYVATLPPPGLARVSVPSVPQGANRRVLPPPIPPPLPGEAARPAWFRGFRPSRFFIGLVVVCFVCTVAALIFGNAVTRIFVPLVALASLNGYRVGGLKVVAGVLGLVVGATAGFSAGRLCEGLVGRLLGLSGLTNRLVSIGIAAVLLALLASFLLDFYVGRRLRRRPAVRRVDPWIGSALGAAQGAVLVLVLLWGVLVLEPVAAAQVAMIAPGQDAAQSDPTAVRILSMAGAVHESVVGRVADNVNPLSNVRAFQLPNKCLAMLNNPRAVEAFNKHPAIKRLGERPVVKEVVKVLAEDPEISRMLASETGISRRDLAVLLSHPKILEVLDRSDVMADVAPIAEDIEEAVDQALADAAGPRSPAAPAQPPRR